MTFRDRMRQLLSVVALFAFVFWLGSAISAITGLVQSRTAEAQTYVRPSKGKPIMLGSMQMTGSSSITSSIYDWSAFAGATMVIERTSVSVACPLPVVTVLNYATATGTAGTSTALNSQHVYRTTPGGNSAVDTYYVPIGAPYVSFLVGSVDHYDTAGNSYNGTTCTYVFYAIPDAFPRVEVREGSSVYNVVASVTTTATEVFSAAASDLSGPRNVTLQNHSTAIVRCLPGTESPIETASFSGYPLILAAESVAGNGAGGVITLYDFSGSVRCRSSTGTASVGVTAY